MNTEEISIRIATPEDAKKLLKIYAPYVTETAVTFEYEVPSVEEFAGRISHVLEKYPYLIAEMNGQAVGYAYAGPLKTRAAYDWAVETTIYVDKDVKKCGVGRKLYNTLEKILKAQNILNLNACIAYPAEENEYLTKDSKHFHEHLGYHLVGEFHQCGYKFGRWFNMIWMEKHIGEHVENQPAVKMFSEIRTEVL